MSAFGSGPTPADLRAMSQGAQFAALMPELEAQVSKLQKEVQARVYAAIRDGTLTDEAAKLAWIELYTQAGLLRKLATKVNLGRGVGEMFADHMKIGE